jgi:hypothetical protein
VRYNATTQQKEFDPGWSPMPIVAHDHEQPRRAWTLRLFVAHGIAGAAILVWLTVVRWEETAATLARIDHGPLVVTIFVALTLASSLLKFQLTDKVFVSVILINSTAMVPLLGGVVAAWIAVFASVTSRLLALRWNRTDHDLRSCERRRDGGVQDGSIGSFAEVAPSPLCLL